MCRNSYDVYLSPLTEADYSRYYKKFFDQNWYASRLKFPGEGYSNPDYRHEISHLKERVWEDVKLQLTQTFFVSSIDEIEDAHKEYVEKFILKYYEPSPHLITELDKAILKLTSIHLESRNATRSKRMKKINQFKEQIAHRVNHSPSQFVTDLEKTINNINTPVNISIQRNQSHFIVPNENGSHAIRFTLTFEN